MNIRIGIIGAGAVAQHHLKVLASFDDVTLSALANRNPDRRKETAETFSIPTTYGTHEEMLEQESLDALLVLTSADTIYPITKSLIPKGLPLLIEKPAGRTAAETRELAELARQSATRVMVGYNRRFYSVINAARRAIEERGILHGIAMDAPERIDAVRALGKFSDSLIEDWLVLNGTHGLDLLRYLGGDIAAARAFHQSFQEKHGDNFGAVLSYVNGTIGHYLSHWNSPGRWQLTLYGTGVRARLEPIEQGTLLIGEESLPLPIDPIDTEYKPGFYAQARYFIDRVRDGGAIERPACSIDDAVGTMELAELISGRSA
ncbi:MAG: Gfo/Idh/MocA family oxidoreductase [Patescibacteria group bacterium]